MRKVQQLIASGMKSSLDDLNRKHKTTALFASSVIQAIKESEAEGSKELQTKGIDTMAPDKQAYYVSLALREIKNIIEVANFNLEGALTPGKPIVNNMYFEKDGKAIIEVHVPFDMEVQGDDFSNVSGAFNLELRKEYADLVTYNVKLPTVAKPSVAVDLTITLPSALCTSIGADKFDTRTKVLQKYMEGLLKKELS